MGRAAQCGGQRISGAIRKRQLVPIVVSALAESGLAPSRMELEVTESVLFRDHQSALKTLYSIRDLGVRVSMDDFGTGFSSLSYLHSFPFDKLKIDQSFVRGQKNGANGMQIVRSIAALGRSLGMSITAEGVETSAQLAAVADSGCTDVQGYLISRPLPADHVPTFLSGNSWHPHTRAFVPSILKEDTDVQ